MCATFNCYLFAAALENMAIIELRVVTCDLPTFIRDEPLVKFVKHVHETQ